MEDRYPEKVVPTPGEAFIVLILTVLVPIFFVLILSAWGISAQSKTSLLITEIFTILPALLFLYAKNFSISTVLRLQPVSIRILGISVIIGIALALIGDEIERLMNFILPLPDEIESVFSASLKEMLTANNIGEWLSLVLSTVVIAGLFEEMLFRGLLQNALENRLDITRAVLATAIVFSFIHFNPLWVVPIAILGVFLGVLAWKSNSILPGAVVHAVNNGIALIMNNIPEEKTNFLNWNGHVNPLLLIAAGIALYYAVLLFYRFVEEDAEISTFLNQPQ